MTNPRRNTDVHVYFVQADDDGPIKIGVAVDVPKRLEMMQVGTHHRLTVRASMVMATRAEAVRMERSIHELFDYARVGGEWFAAHVDLVGLIEGVLLHGKDVFEEEKGRSLYCPICGCNYTRRCGVMPVGYGRWRGETCGDCSATGQPCPGVMELSEYTDEIRRRQGHDG